MIKEDIKNYEDVITYIQQDLDLGGYEPVPEGLDKRGYNEWINSVLKEHPEYLRDWRWRITHLYHITTKDSGKKVIFVPNKVQRMFLKLNELFNKLIVLKSRQLGMTTLVCIKLLDIALFESNKDIAMIAHTKIAAQEIFSKKAQYAINNLPDSVRAGINITKNAWGEIQVQKKNGDMNMFTVKNTSRGTTPTNTHISELGKLSKESPIVAEEIVTGSLSAVATNNEVIIESTAEGAVGHFYDLFMTSWNQRDKIIPGSFTASQLCFPVFFPWMLDTDNIDTIKETELMTYKDMEVDDIDWRIFQEENQLSDKELTWYYTKWNGLMKNTNRLFQEYPTNPMDAFIASGQCYFSQRRIADLLLGAEKTVVPRTYIIEGEELVNEWNGPLKIYFKPEKKYTYVVGGDVGQGLDNGDFSTMAVVCEQTGTLCAVYRARIEPDSFADELVVVAKYFNNAKIVCESNKDGLWVNTKIFNTIGYSNIYIQQAYDTVNKKYSKKLGWETTKKTRDLSLNALRKQFASTKEWYNKELLEEMQTFVMNKRGRFEAATKCHDDLVMCTAIAYGYLNFSANKEVKKEENSEKMTLMHVAFGEITMEQYLNYMKKQKNS